MDNNCVKLTRNGELTNRIFKRWWQVLFSIEEYSKNFSFANFIEGQMHLNGLCLCRYAVDRIRLCPNQYI